VLRNIGVRDQALDVRCTLWPSHAGVEIAQNDAVLVEGKFTVNKAKDKDGADQTYFNLSVSTILNFGPGDRGERSDAPAPAKAAKTAKNDTPDTDDIPY
jgi:hypothetical protein